MKSKLFHMISLGCAKNTVDSASMAQILGNAGYQSTDHPAKAKILIVNTCGFIKPARDESFGVLEELAEQKLPGQILIAAGCLSQRYGAEVAQRVKGIDGILGTRRWMDILDVVETLRYGQHPDPYIILQLRQLWALMSMAPCARVVRAPVRLSRSRMVAGGPVPFAPYL
jgi:ribosomal protein S12 methylthiotransferase